MSALKYIWPLAFAGILILLIRVALPVACVGIAGMAVYFGLASFGVAHAARQTRCVWSGTGWVSCQADPRRFRRMMIRFYSLAVLEWSMALVALLFAVGILHIPG